MRLGAIADDLTGATDLAGVLREAGLRVLLSLGVPPAAATAPGVDAWIIALKSRSNPADEAVAESRAALRALQATGAGQVYFKICSTFDSTPGGNIGPVLDALCAALEIAPGSTPTPVVPSYPANGRRVFQGHLFVGEQLLSDSPMRDHPLTPMTDADLRRVLGAQLREGRRCGLLAWPTVAAGDATLREVAACLGADGHDYAIVDALDEGDLDHIARAFADAPLWCAGSGLGGALGRAWGFHSGSADPAWLPAGGRRAVVAGSCSAASRRQLAAARAVGMPCWPLPLQAVQDDDADRWAAEAMAWLAMQDPARTPVFHATDEQEAVRSLQAHHGVQASGERIEAVLAAIAVALVQRQGVRQLLVAGGETAGACARALGVNVLRIGPRIAPGVPWCQVDGPDGPLHLAFKSGNFGADDCYVNAFERLPS